MALATRIAVMDAGRIVQTGTPEDVYRRPASEVVARFIGSANLVPGRVMDTSCAPRVRVWTEMGDLHLDAGQPVAVGDEVLAAIRPEQLTLHAIAPKPGGAVEAVVVHRMFAGAMAECVLEAGSLRLRAQAPGGAEHRRGAKVFVVLHDGGCVLVPRGAGAPRPAP